MDRSKIEEEAIEKAISRMQKKFQDGIPDEKKLKYLKQLSQLPITLKILKDTSIGKTVNKLKQEDGKLGKKAMQLVNKWKEIANSEKKTETPEKSKIRHEEKSPIQTNGESKRISLLNSPTNSVVEKKTNNKNRSFEDMLLMPLYEMEKKKKKKHKDEKSPMKLSLNHNKVTMPSLPDISLPSFTPEPVYKPSRPPPELPLKAEKRQRESSGALLSDITSKKTRSQMYSGKRTTTVLLSLYQICMKVLVENIDNLYETGGVPYSLLEPLLSKCTPLQLERLEYYNEYLIEDCDVLWKKHCQNEFKSSRINKEEDEEWREVFKRLSEEREERLKRLSVKINASQAAKDPERSVKLAYVVGAPKASTQMTKRQKKYGTGEESQAGIIERMDKDQRKLAEVAIPFANVPRRERCSVRPPSSLSSSRQHDLPSHKRRKEDIGSQGPSRLMPTAPKKPAKKPMMAAALKLMKSQKGRVNSRIMRR